MSREHIEVEFTFEPYVEVEGRKYVLASYDARAEVEVIDDGEDWSIGKLWVEGVDFQRPTAGDLRARRVTRWFPCPAHYEAAMRAEAERIMPDRIVEAIDRGDIGPAARREARAEYARDLAREDAMLLAGPVAMGGGS